MDNPNWKSLIPLYFVLGTIPILAGCRSACFEKRGHQDPVRAGLPEEVSTLAKPSDTGRYFGYQGGGGAWSWRRGDQPTPDEGTWGWDYGGLHFPSFTALGWWHGRRYQGGEGAYKVEQPGLVEKLKEKREIKESND